jgi:hypothetical protein
LWRVAEVFARTDRIDRSREAYHETLATLEERSRIAPERINLMLLRGYAYLKLHRFADAEQVFRAAAATGDHDALRGLGDLRQSA